MRIHRGPPLQQALHGAVAVDLLELQDQRDVLGATALPGWVGID